MPAEAEETTAHVTASSAYLQPLAVLDLGVSSCVSKGLKPRTVEVSPVWTLGTQVLSSSELPLGLQLVYSTVCGALPTCCRGREPTPQDDPAEVVATLLVCIVQCLSHKKAECQQAVRSHGLPAVQPLRLQTSLRPGTPADWRCYGTCSYGGPPAAAVSGSSRPSHAVQAGDSHPWLCCADGAPALNLLCSSATPIPRVSWPKQPACL